MKRAVKETEKPAVKTAPVAAAKETAVEKSEAVKTVAKAAEKTVKAAEKTVKEAAKKVEAVKEETKKTVAKAAEKKTATEKKAVKETVYLQYMGKEVDKDDLMKQIKEIWTKQMKRKVGEMKSVTLYLKPEENKVYYVVNGDVTGSLEI